MGYRDELKRLEKKGSKQSSKGVPFALVVLLLLSVGVGVTYALRPDLIQSLISQVFGGGVTISEDSRQFPVDSEATSSAQQPPTARVETQIIQQEEPQQRPLTRRRQREPVAESQDNLHAETQGTIRRPTPAPAPELPSPTSSEETGEQRATDLPLPGLILNSYQSRGAGAALFIDQGVIALYNKEGLSHQAVVPASGLLPGVYTISSEYSAAGAFVFSKSEVPMLVVLFAGSQPTVMAVTSSLPEVEAEENAVLAPATELPNQVNTQQPEVLYLSLPPQVFRELQRVIGITGSLQVF